jgi:uncharacterized membrane protein YkvA (DUF1232 family)
MQGIARWRLWARQLKTKTYAVYLACKDPRTPWYARLFGVAVVAYAFSPIDLIPDFIPVLGHLDDLIIVPLGIAIALRMIPQNVLDECQNTAQQMLESGKPTNWVATCVIVAIWLLVVALTVWLLWRGFGNN